MASSVLSRSFSRRRALATAAGAAGAIAIGSTAAAAAQGGEAGSGPVSSGQMAEGIVVSGNGQASAPAESAIVQYIIRYAYDAPQVTDDPTESIDKGYYGGGYPAPDADSLAHVVEALVGAGIPSASVKTFVGSDAMYGPFGSGVSVVGAEIVDVELIASLQEILEAGAEAASETKLQIDSIGAVFTTADCESVNDEALAAAVTDANVQAEALAKALGATLGELVGAASSPSYGPYSGYGGMGGPCQTVLTLDDAGTTYFPSYVAGSEPEFLINASVTLTFAIA